MFSCNHKLYIYDKKIVKKYYKIGIQIYKVGNLGIQLARIRMLKSIIFFCVFLVPNTLML